GANPIPLGADAAAVTAELLLRCPADILTVVARGPIAQPVNPEIQLTPNTVDVRNAVTAALEALFAAESVPGGTIPGSHLGEAISAAPGETSHAILAPAGGVVALSPDHLPMVGTPIYA
ncbi:MAG: baseplate J/gp47 family protein, partial [Polyangiaceae bacterium]|nr:baseplate J/gp47 family protein [Polyangiaceae bacterium]